jgi:uncharacterized coiled-coil protein SlyX
MDAQLQNVLNKINENITALRDQVQKVQQDTANLRVQVQRLEGRFLNFEGHIIENELRELAAESHGEKFAKKEVIDSISRLTSLLLKQKDDNSSKRMTTVLEKSYNVVKTLLKVRFLFVHYQLFE